MAVPMSENEFYQLQGDSYRGSRYSNFTGGGTDPQGNVSSAITENSANQVGKSADAAATPITPSTGLTGGPSRTQDLVIGAALPYAGNAVGQAAGSAIGAGASFGEGLKTGVSSLANTVSGGLIGTAATPTNLAIGAGIGPATPAAVNAASTASNVGQFGSAANIGGAVGSGFASAAATLLTGGNIGQAAKVGIGSAVGTAIGNAILPGIGGFVGGFLGSTIFCFDPDSLVLIADGSEKAVDLLDLGDELAGGSKVIGKGYSYATDMYSYKGSRLTGAHAVFEDGKWIRVKDSTHSLLLEQLDERVVCPVATSNHLIVTPGFIAADIFEIDPDPSKGYSDDDRLVLLNADTVRNATLAAFWEKHYKGEACGTISKH